MTILVIVFTSLQVFVGSMPGVSAEKLPIAVNERNIDVRRIQYCHSLQNLGDDFSNQVTRVIVSAPYFYHVT